MSILNKLINMGFKKDVRIFMMFVYYTLGVFIVVAIPTMVVKELLK